MKALEQVLADHRGDAAVLRRQGHTAQASSIEKVCDDVGESMRAFLTIKTEAEAQLQSGWSRERLRARFPEWEARGLAMLDAQGKRVYREIAVPMRLEESAAKLAGTRGESLRAHG